jgi:hypothetical protein
MRTTAACETLLGLFFIANLFRENFLVEEPQKIDDLEFHVVPTNVMSSDYWQNPLRLCEPRRDFSESRENFRGERAGLLGYTLCPESDLRV